MDPMNIGKVARKSGLRPSAIRYYEKLGLIAKTARSKGRRKYEDKILQRLAIVRFARCVGFSLAEIKFLLDGFDLQPPSQRWQALAEHKLAQLNKLILEAKNVRESLLETLQQKCPKLAERGRALSDDRGSSRPKDVVQRDQRFSAKC